jgi:hypothetical protein
VTCGEEQEGALTSADACRHLTAADIGDGARVPQLCPGPIRRASRSSPPLPVVPGGSKAWQSQPRRCTSRRSLRMKVQFQPSEQSNAAQHEKYDHQDRAGQSYCAEPALPCLVYTSEEGPCRRRRGLRTARRTRPRRTRSQWFVDGALAPGSWSPPTQDRTMCDASARGTLPSIFQPLRARPPESHSILHLPRRRSRGPRLLRLGRVCCCQNCCHSHGPAVSNGCW